MAVKKDVDVHDITIDAILDELAIDPKVAEDEAPPVSWEYEVPEDLVKEGPLIPPPRKVPRLYLGLFSIIGLAFVALTVLALIATIITLRWDTWINGAAEENIGDRQSSYIYLGTVLIVLGSIISLVDFNKQRRENK